MIYYNEYLADKDKLLRTCLMITWNGIKVLETGLKKTLNYMKNCTNFYYYEYVKYEL